MPYNDIKCLMSNEIEKFSNRLEKCESFQAIAHETEDAYKMCFEIAQDADEKMGDLRKLANSTLLNKVMYWVLIKSLKPITSSILKVGYNCTCMANVRGTDNKLYIQHKDMDAAIFVEVNLKEDKYSWLDMSSGKMLPKYNVPIIGIEVKHYIDCTMLDTIWATSNQLFYALLFAKYIGVSNLRGMSAKLLIMRAEWKMRKDTLYFLRDTGRSNHDWSRENQTPIDFNKLQVLSLAITNDLTKLASSDKLDIYADYGSHGEAEYKKVYEIKIKGN